MEQMNEQFRSENDVEALALYVGWINDNRYNEALFYCLHLEMCEPETPEEDILNLWSNITEPLATWIRDKCPDKEHVADYIETFWKDEPENGLLQAQISSRFSAPQLEKLIFLLDEQEERLDQLEQGGG